MLLPKTQQKCEPKRNSMDFASVAFSDVDASRKKNDDKGYEVGKRDVSID